MLSTRAMRRTGTVALLALALVGVSAAPASAQGRANEGAVRIGGGLDVGSGYMFRGFRQDRHVEQFRRGSLREDRDLVIAPRLDLGVRLWSGQGDLRSVGVRVETANRLHTGPTGRRGEGQSMWNESTFTTAILMEMGRGVSTEVGYNNYSSPNDLGLTARELFLRVDVDDRDLLGRASVRPYALLAGEIDARRAGSADCVPTQGIACVGGSYLELGARPGRDYGRFQIEVPVRVGMSLKDYYIHPTSRRDNRYGFASAGLFGTYPFSQTPTRYGSWNLHGGVEWHNLGATTRAWNVNVDGRPRPNRVTGSVGIGFTY